MGVLDWIKKKMDEDIAGERDFAAEAAKKMEEEHQAAVKKMEESEEERQALRSVRISELKQAFEASGRKQNFAEPGEAETLLTLTEKKIIQQCRRPHCHGCKLGWICPKFWSE